MRPEGFRQWSKIMSLKTLIVVSIPLLLLLSTAAVHAEDRAILIGAGKYASGKWTLELVDENIRLMEEVLTGEVGIPKDNVARITNESVTRTGVIRALRQAARAGKAGDRLFVYYTGHATKVIVGGAHLRAYFTWDTLESDRDEGFDSETLFTDIDLKNWIAPIKAKGIVVIVFREACFTGSGYARDISALAPGKPPVREPVGDLEISACDVDQAAWALESAKRPVALFTYCLAEALSADRQKISARSLFDTVRGRVSRLRRGQTPILDSRKGIDPAAVVLVDRTLFDLIVDVTDAVTGEPLTGVAIQLETIGSRTARTARTPDARICDVPRQARVFPWIEKAGYVPKRHAVEVPRKQKALRTSVALAPEFAEVTGRIAAASGVSLSGVTVTYESGARPLDARHVDREVAVGGDRSFTLRVPSGGPCRISVVKGADTLASVTVDRGNNLNPIRFFDGAEKRWAGQSYDVGALAIDSYLLGAPAKPAADTGKREAPPENGATPAKPAEGGAEPDDIASEKEFWKGKTKPPPDQGADEKTGTTKGNEFWNDPYPGFASCPDRIINAGGRLRKVKIYKHRATGLEFVLVPGASVTMGTPEGAPGRYGNEGPEHRVKIKPFLLCRTECTQEAWDKIGGNDIRQWKGADLPIERVSWDDCTIWCRKAGLRLPTEAEWEYACRAGTSTAFYAGNGEADLDAIGWYRKNADGRTHPVGKKKSNAFGLVDMSGNVWEWCEDTWHENYVGAPRDGTAWIGEDAAKRVVRGACWESQAQYCRSFTRTAFRQGLRDSSTGFRPACSLP